MKLSQYEYRDPAQVVRDVADRHPLQAGDVLLALVHRPSTDQEVVAVTRLVPERWQGIDQFDRAELLAEHVRAMPIPEWRAEAPEHSIMTIVARFGWCLMGPSEGEWLSAWLFSNHLCHTFSGDLILVAEHGWTDFTTGLGGDDPRLSPLAAA